MNIAPPFTSVGTGHRAFPGGAANSRVARPHLPAAQQLGAVISAWMPSSSVRFADEHGQVLARFLPRRVCRPGPGEGRNVTLRRTQGDRYGS